MKDERNMDHNIYNLRLDVLANASIKTRYLYENLNRDGFIDNLFLKNGLPEETYATFVLTIGDVILGFYKIEDTVPLLQQELGLDPKTAALLGAEVLEFLAPLSDPTWQPPVEESEDDVMERGDMPPVAPDVAVSRIPVKAPAFYGESFTTPSPTPIAVAPAAPIYTPPAPATTTPVYTPSYESAPTPLPTPEPVYQSSQPTSIRPPLSSIPSYTPPAIPPTPVPQPPAPDRPRWSTDI
jgi:hypothetical protein